MLRWVLFFLILSLVTGIFGFSQLAMQSPLFDKILFFIFLSLFFIALVLLILSRKKS